MKRDRLWRVRESPSAAAVDQIRAGSGGVLYGLPARLLAVRGYRTGMEIRAYLGPKEEHLHDPFCMKNMEALVDRLVRAIRAGEKILVWGDYDVDGTMTTSLYVRTLRRLGACVDFYIPVRAEDGYGVNVQKLPRIAAAGFSLILTGDTGSSASMAAVRAGELGIDFGSGVIKRFNSEVFL